VLVLGQLGLIQANLRWARTGPRAAGANPAWRWIVWGTLGLLALVLGLPPLAALLRFGALSPALLAGVLGLGGLSWLWSRAVVGWWRRPA